MLIDAAHLEAFARAPEDVSLRRLVGYGLGPQLKSSFEQIFSAPFLAELLLAELGPEPGRDLFFRLHFDGAFETKQGGVCAAAPAKELEEAARQWLDGLVHAGTELSEAIDLTLQAWWVATSGASFTSATPPAEERQKGWRSAVLGKTVEIGWLDRQAVRPARYRVITLAELGLA
jgi:proteasome alpha subunit